MTNNIIDHWQSKTEIAQRAYVIPDGCQDIIFDIQFNQPIRIYITPVFQHTISVEMFPGRVMTGIRLCPGCHLDRLDKQELLYRQFSADELMDYIEGVTYTDQRVVEALECIKHNSTSTHHCATVLGVSSRTLQRLLIKHTSYSPSFWVRLARSRQCAKALISNNHSYSEIAHQCHYADQAHMCREIKHWFSVSPSKLLKRPDLMAQLSLNAY